MIKNNEKKILKEIKKGDLFLDIGGWDRPFNRANYILDIHPFETRGFHGSQGGEKEHFSKKTWIIHDVCSNERLPFKDNQFDFVICSHILEDIRNPLQLCSEIMRIGKRGYIEVPSMDVELIKGLVNKKYAGYYHHRWLVDIVENKIIFRFKPHFIHGNKKFHFPKRFLKKIEQEKTAKFLFWNKKFSFEERIQISRDKSEEFIYNYIKERYPRKLFYFFLDLFSNICKKFENLKKKILPKKYYHKYMNVQEIISK